jgi:hypothetical protein
MLPTATSDQLLQQSLAMSILLMRDLNSDNTRKEKPATD